MLDPAYRVVAIMDSIERTFLLRADEQVPFNLENDRGCIAPEK